MAKCSKFLLYLTIIKTETCKVPEIHENAEIALNGTGYIKINTV